MNKSTQKNRSLVGGFTLIEILIVIGIIAILAAIVIVAINPSRQFAQARNTQRQSNVSTILNAIGQNTADNKGIFNCNATTSIPNIDPIDYDDGDVIGEDDVDLKDCLIPTYIPSEELPYDPTITSVASAIDDTGYTIQVDDLGRYTVCAPGFVEAAIPEITDPYCLTR